MDQPTLRTFIVAVAAVCTLLLLAFIGLAFVLLQGGFTFSEEVGSAFNAFVLSLLTLALTTSGIWGRAMLKRNTEITEAAANGQRDELMQLQRENKELIARIARLELLLEQKNEES